MAKHDAEQRKLWDEAEAARNDPKIVTVLTRYADRFEEICQRFNLAGQYEHASSWRDAALLIRQELWMHE